MNRRQWLGGALGLAGGALTGCALERGDFEFDAAVTRSDRPDLRARHFASLQSAIDAAPAAGTKPFRIFVGAGEWREKVIVTQPNVHLIGEDRAGSALVFDAAAGDPGPDGKPLGTWGCASVVVRAPGFAARNLTIRNGFDYVGNLLHPRFQEIGPNGAQAVALMLAAGSDRAAFADVTITGHQDTLFADRGRSHFRRCRIEGSVDFIFGGDTALLESCDIHSRYRPGKERQGYLAAPSTPREREFGVTFESCRLVREPQIAAGTVALGRAWRPTRPFPDGTYGDPDALGAAVFLRCWMDDHIAADGWDAMNYRARDGNRVALAPGEARFFEYASEGPGALESAHRRRLSAAQAQRYTVDRILDGWRPAVA